MEAEKRGKGHHQRRDPSPTQRPLLGLDRVAWLVKHVHENPYRQAEILRPAVIPEQAAPPQ